jgi:tryptophan-rich sensory protein
MNYTALFQAIGLCFVFVLIEAAGTTKSGKIWFENLKKPRFSLPFMVWYIVGGLYYVICGIIAYRIFAAPDTELLLRLLPLGLMMLANGTGNFLLFRLRSVAWFYISLFPFTAILLFLYVQLLQTDKISSWVLLPYIIWLIYDFYYLHALWKLNK